MTNNYIGRNLEKKKNINMNNNKRISGPAQPIRELSHDSSQPITELPIVTLISLLMLHLVTLHSQKCAPISAPVNFFFFILNYIPLDNIWIDHSYHF